MKFNPETIHSLSADEKIRPFAEIPGIIRKLGRAGITVVLAQGVFDIVHRGHVGYLRASRVAASANGLVIVGVENDEAVRRNKGDKRPINPLEDRLEILAEFMSTGLVFAYEDAPSYTNPQEYTTRYQQLGPAAIAVPAWDPHRRLKAYQAQKAQTELAIVDYKHTNSTTQMLRRVGFKE